MVHGVCWTELTDIRSYGSSGMLDGTDLQLHLWCVVCVGRNWLTVAVILQGVCWMELTDRGSYGASCVFDGTESSCHRVSCLLNGTE